MSRPWFNIVNKLQSFNYSKIYFYIKVHLALSVANSLCMVILSQNHTDSHMPSQEGHAQSNPILC